MDRMYLLQKNVIPDYLHQIKESYCEFKNGDVATDARSAKWPNVRHTAKWHVTQGCLVSTDAQCAKWPNVKCTTKCASSLRAELCRQMHDASYGQASDQLPSAHCSGLPCVDIHTMRQMVKRRLYNYKL